VVLSRSVQDTSIVKIVLFIVWV